MFNKISLTLVVYLVAIFAISTLVEAKSFDSVNRRDHENLKRLIKKRVAIEVPEGVGSDADSVTASAAGASSATAGSSSSSATSTPTTSATSASSSSNSASSSSSSPASPSSSSSSSSSSSTSASSTSASSSSSSSSSSSLSALSAATSATSSAATSAAAQTSQAPATLVDTETTLVSGSKVTLTRTASASSSATAGVSEDVSTSPSGKSIGLTVVIVIAASVGGVAIIWTIFRKWKLGRSSKFDQRMQPINWQPTSEEPDSIAHGINRRPSNSSSFHSGHGGGSDMGHGGSDHGYPAYGAADLPPLPSHDFTAGPAHLAPVGGYADLARGPSPQPQMHEALSRGPSIHQTGYGTRY